MGASKWLLTMGFDMRSIAVIGLATSLLLPISRGGPQENDDPNAFPTEMTKAQLDVLMKDWEKLTKEKLSKVPALKNLMEKYPLVLLHSRRYANLVGDGYGASAYSFNYKATDEVKHKVDIQLLFDNGRGDNTFEIISCVDDQNLIADLGEVDFTKDPDVKKISLEGYGLNSWDPKNKKVLDGHVYVE